MELSFQLIDFLAASECGGIVWFRVAREKCRESLEEDHPASVFFEERSFDRCRMTIIRPLVLYRHPACGVGREMSHANAKFNNSYEL